MMVKYYQKHDVVLQTFLVRGKAKAGSVINDTWYNGEKPVGLWPKTCIIKACRGFYLVKVEDRNLSLQR